GEPQKLTVHLDDLNQSFQSPEPFRIGAGGGPQARFRGRIGDVRVYHRALSDEEVKVVATPDSITDIASLPRERRTPLQRHKLEMYCRQGLPSWEELSRLREQREQLWERIPTTMVMEELPTPRDTHVLIRGEYDKRGEKVMPGVPAALSPWPKDAP